MRMPIRKWPKCLAFWPRRLPGSHQAKRDEYGRSARQRCFDHFDQGKRPAEVRRLVLEVKEKTVLRYFEDWKKVGRDFSMRHRQVRAYLKKDGELSANAIKKLSEELEMTPAEIVARLQKPWGIYQLLTGGWPNYRKERARNKAEKRLRSALTILRMVELGAEVSTEDAAAMIEDLTRRVIETWKTKDKEQKKNE